MVRPTQRDGHTGTLVVVTTFRRLLPARREAVLGVIDDALAFLSGCDLTPRTGNSVDLALEELLSNVYKYAYPGGVPGQVEVAIDVGQEAIRLEVADWGIPFDPTTVPAPPRPTLDEPRGGRGLFLVRSVARSLRYRRDGSRNVTSVEFSPA